MEENPDQQHQCLAFINPWSEFSFCLTRQDAHAPWAEPILEAETKGSHCFDYSPTTLDALLTRHSNLHIDTSATKWVVRELSRHPVSRVVEFFTRWQDRILFGTDIVTSDDHLKPAKDNPTHPKADQANSPASAFDLYASRFWALRSVIGGGYAGPSPIADGDLAMVDPARYSPDDAPMLRGVALPDGVLDKIMFANAERVVGGWWDGHGGW